MYVYVWTDTVDKKKLQTAYTLSLSLSQQECKVSLDLERIRFNIHLQEAIIDHTLSQQVSRPLNYNILLNGWK